MQKEKKYLEFSAPFTDCISKINNTKIEKAKVTPVALSMYHFMEYSNNYSEISRSNWWSD